MKKKKNKAKEEVPEIYALKRMNGSWTLSRRDFLTAAGVIAGSTLIESGCNTGKKVDQSQTVKAPSCEDIYAHTAVVNALAITPDGKILASGSWDKTIKLWSLPEGSLIKTLKGHTDWVKALAITPDGKILASGSSDKTIKLWSLPEGEWKMCLMDLKACPDSVKGVQYKAKNEYGEWVTYTLPCGSPIPPGAVCVCNCVPGSIATPKPSAPSGGQYCTCVPVHYWYPN